MLQPMPTTKMMLALLAPSPCYHQSYSLPPEPQYNGPNPNDPKWYDHKIQFPNPKISLWHLDLPSQ
eukprot:6794872-Alexandrium_andersonii.AAC.1